MCDKDTVPFLFQNRRKEADANDLYRTNCQEGCVPDDQGNCCSLNAETSKDILSYEVTRAIKAAVKDSECRLCNYLFKLCGEMGLLSYLVGADLINMTDEEINQCRRKAFDVVRRERGMLKLEDVVKDERAIAESDY